MNERQKTVTRFLLLREKNYSPETYLHSERVAGLIKQLAKECGYAGDIEELELGAMLHDIGKLLIPLSILHKNGPLDKEERAIIDKHSEYGYDIAEKCQCYSRFVLSMIFTHHEKMNGSGPAGYKNIPVETQMLTVCDIYDALTSKRSYKKPMSAEQAFQILYSMAKKNEVNIIFVEALKNSMLHEAVPTEKEYI